MDIIAICRNSNIFLIWLRKLRNNFERVSRYVNNVQKVIDKILQLKISIPKDPTSNLSLGFLEVLNKIRFKKKNHISYWPSELDDAKNFQ